MDKVFCGNGIGDMWVRRCAPESLGIYLVENAHTPDYVVPIPTELQESFITSAGKRGSRREYLVPTSRLVMLPQMRTAIERAIYQK